MAHQLRALAALPEDPGSAPSTYMAAHNCYSSSRGYGTLTQTYIHAGKTPMHIKVNKSLKKEREYLLLLQST